MRTWINGRRGSSIAADDRGLQYGDGLFETMRIGERRVRLLDYHLERLLAGCRRLRLDAPDARLLERELAGRAAECSAGVLKLIITRGRGARGYRPSGEERCTRVLSLHSLPPSMRAALAPVRIRVCATRVGSNPALAGLKTLNRLESVIARTEWRDERIWDGLMLDADGNVVSGTMSNVFLRRGSTLMTPALDRCGVAGVMRRWVLEQAAPLGLRVWQGRLPLESINDAEEMFMTNAVAGIVSVARIEQGEAPLGVARPGTGRRGAAGPGAARRGVAQRETADRLRARLELV
jgi:4-amino-4-deoxychorismate lyase